MSAQVDLSFHTLISLSSKIFNKEDLQSHISPEDFVNFVNNSLDRPTDKWEKHCCDVINSSAKRKHSQRLLLISCLQKILQQSHQGIDNFDPVTEIKTASSPDHRYISEFYKALRSDDTRNRKEFGHSTQISSESCSVSEASEWYKRTSHLLLKKDSFIDIMIELYQNGCVFTSYLAKKIVIDGIKCNPIKTIIILKNTEALLSKDSENGIRVFDLLNEFMSTRNFERDSPVFKLIYDWFADYFKDKLVFSLARIVKKNSYDKDECTLLIHWFSSLIKIMKYGHVNCKKIIPDILSLAVDILVKLVHMTYLKPHDKEHYYYLVILKNIKLLNAALDLDIILKKDIISKEILEIAVKVLKNFPFFFTTLKASYLSFNKLFWGNKSQDIKTTDKTQNSNCNYRMARQFLLLSSKSCLFSSYLDSIQDVEVKHSAHQIIDMFKIWLQDQNSGIDTFECLPAFLGDQDDQWITVLLCLLLIYINVNKKQKSQVSSSEPSYQSGAVKYNTKTKNSAKEHDNIDAFSTVNIYENHLSSSSPISENDSHYMFHDSICPHRLFLQFVNFIAYDHLVIADFLLSPETYFLAYFTKYLTVLNHEWDIFCKNYSKTDTTLVIGYKCKQNTESNCQQKDITNSHTTSIVKSQECQLSLNMTMSKDYPSSYLSNSQMYRYIPSHLQEDDLSKEPPDKKIRLKQTQYSTPSTKSKCKAVTDDESCKEEQKMTFPLVSYSDSEDSDSVEYTTDYDNSLLLLTSKGLGCDLSASTNTSDKEKAKYFFRSHEQSSVQEEYSESNSDDIHIPSCRSPDDNKIDSNQDMKKGYISNPLEKCMTMLIRLQLHLERLNNHHLIPYNVNLLLKLLDMCIDKYESS